MPARLPPTTTLGEADDVTRALELALFQEDVAALAGPLASGAVLDCECMVHETREGGFITGLTATSWAVALDADADGLFLLPLLLRHGGRIDQVDTQGRSLLHFAWSWPTAHYLLEHGVPVTGGEATRRTLLALVRTPEPITASELDRKLRGIDPQLCVLIERVLRRAGALRDNVGIESCLGKGPMLPRATWGRVLDRDILVALKRLSYAEQPIGPADKLISALPPLWAAFHPAEAIGWALRARDESRVTRLIKLGGANGSYRFSHALELFHIAYEYRGLTATGLALLIDCENERRSAGSGPWVARLPVSHPFSTRLARATDLTGAHDSSGNTLLHLAISPGLCAWLLEQGLRPDILNAAGQRPVDVVPDDVRSVLQRHLSDTAPPATKKRRSKSRQRL